MRTDLLLRHADSWWLMYCLERLNSIQARYSARQAMWERHQELLREYPDILVRSNS